MSATELRAISQQISELREKHAELLKTVEPEPVSDYDFVTTTGSVKLSELFGDKQDLIVIHNMGRSCPYCSLWADGFSGYLRHLEDRAAFVLVSPDDPATQAAFAAERGWKFRMVQDATREFSTAMGMWNEKDGFWPGFSAFHRGSDGALVRTGNPEFGPFDDYCAVWPMFARLKDGINGWEPR